MTAGTKENAIAYAWTIFNIYYLPAEVEKKYMHYPGICCSPLIISALSPKKCSGYTGICHSCLLCWLVPLKQKLSHCTHAQQDKKCGPHMTDIDFPVDKYYAQQAGNVPQPLHRDGGWLQVYVPNIKSGNDCGSLMSSAEPAQNGGLKTHSKKIPYSKCW